MERRKIFLTAVVSGFSYFIRRKEMQKKDVYLICITMIICSIIIGLIIGSFILHGLEVIAEIINHGLLTINQSIH